MTWTYLPQNLGTSRRDQTRLLIGDTQNTDQQLQDEEIDYFIGIRPSLYGAAAECCRSVAMKYGRQVDTVIGELRTTYSTRARNYLALAGELEAKAMTDIGATSVFAGGISVADKTQREADSDRVPPQFNIGMDDNFLPVASSGNEDLDR